MSGRTVLKDHAQGHRGPRRAASPTESPAGCWYADATHRPSLGWCPPACNGQVTHSERVRGGELHRYCEAHAYWRRKTTRLPLVRRLPAATGPTGPTGTGTGTGWHPRPHSDGPLPVADSTDESGASADRSPT